jgi:peptidoglycan/xylan/chitin deacetylase (PgdA/CDA1 family)
MPARDRRSLRPAGRPSTARLIALAALLGVCACGGRSATDGTSPDRAGADGPPPTPSHGARTSHGRVLNLGALRRRAAPRPRVIEHGPRDRREVALTFDADMTPQKLAELRAGAGGSTWYDARIVAELERTRTPATIFLTGLWTRVHAGVAQRLARSPLFELENHSLSHRAFDAPCYGLAPVTSAPEKRAEVVRSREIIEETTGVRPRFFRFPGGCHSPADLRRVAAAGEQPLGWDVVSGDAGQPNPAAVVRAVVGGVRPGSIVVMHLVGAPNAPATAVAIREIIPALRARGYAFVRLERLLDAGARRDRAPPR